MGELPPCVLATVSAAAMTPTIAAATGRIAAGRSRFRGFGGRSQSGREIMHTESAISAIKATIMRASLVVGSSRLPLVG